MRKSLLVFVLLLGFGMAWAADAPTPALEAPIKGKVLEVLDAQSFIYLRLQTKDGEKWAVVSKVPIKVGAEVTIDNVATVQNYESKSLKRKFDRIAFGTIGGGGASGMSAAAGGDMVSPHTGVAKSAIVGDVKVAKATGPDARTVAEVVTRKAELKDKTVVVRGKVVKFTGDVLGKNWIHLRDGTGSAADGTDDILVTTKNEAKIGDVVLVKGVVHLDKDFGAGYSYKVLIEDATLQK